MSNASFPKKRLTYLLSSLITSTSLVFIQPAKAATLALSAGLFNIQFHQAPQSISTTTTTKTLSKVNRFSQSEATAFGKAIFFNQPLLANSDSPFCQAFVPTACTLSSSQAQGDGNQYVAIAKTKTEVIGNFSLDAGTNFSFDFSSLSYLQTFSDSYPVETANVYSETSWKLYDKYHWRLLGSLKILKKVNTLGADFFDLDSSHTHQDFLNLDTIINHGILSVNTPNHTNNAYQTLVQGSYSRFFPTSTELIFMGYQKYYSVVKVNEPKNEVAWLILLGFCGIVYKQTHKK